MKLWMVTPVLTAVFFGGTYIAADGHVTGRAAVIQSASKHHGAKHGVAAPSAANPSPPPSPEPSPPPSPAPTPSAAATTAAPLGPPPATQVPVLAQTGPRRWRTTVLLTDTQPACRQSATYWLETTPPTRAVPHAGRPRQTGTPGRAAGPATGSSCQVTVTFTGLRGIPASAALVLDQGGALATIPLTVSRQMTLAWYLWIPGTVGGGMALALLVLCLAFVRIYRDGKRLSPFGGEFWKHPLIASGAWTLNDSWATNITAVLALIGTVLATTTTAGALFPGVTLDRFALLNIAAGGIIVAAPIVFGILYGLVTRANPGPTADATISLPPGGSGPARISVPAGASITAPGGAKVTWDGERSPAELLPGRPVAVPPGSEIAVLPGTRMAIPGTAGIVVHEGGVLRIRHPGRRGTTLVIPPGDRAQPARRVHFPVLRPRAGGTAARGAASPAITLPAQLTTAGAATITVTGTADVTLPAGTRISAPQRRDTPPLNAPRRLQVPQSSGVIVASLWLVLAAAAVTTFGTGAELGIAGVLAFGLSTASAGWRVGMLIAVVAVGLLMLTYAVSAVSALANPVPGSSTSATPGTSFTL